MACKDAVIPNAVGVDIGCGMCAVKSNYKVTDISPDVLRKKLMSGIRQRIPLGMMHHTEPQPECYLPDGHEIARMEVVKRRQAAIVYEVGTLGGGNHFIETLESWFANTTTSLLSSLMRVGIPGLTLNCDWLFYL